MAATIKGREFHAALCEALGIPVTANVVAASLSTPLDAPVEVTIRCMLSPEHATRLAEILSRSPLPRGHQPAPTGKPPGVY